YVDEKSDIYSLGISMFEMATGRLPFDGDNSVAIALKHLNGELPDILQFNPETSNAVIGIIKKATQKSPDKRYANIDLMLADLRTALSELSADFARLKARFAAQERAEARAAQKAQLETDASGGAVAAAAVLESSRQDAKSTVIEMSSLSIKEDANAHAPKKYRMPKSTVGFDQYSKRLRIPQSDSAASKNIRAYPDDDDDYEDYEDFKYEKRGEGRVIVAAIITAALIIAAIVFFGFKFFGNPFDRSGNNDPAPTETFAEGEIPLLVGISFTDAQTIASELGFTVTRGDSLPDEAPSGTVIKQSIDEGTAITDGMNVRLTLSSGEEGQTMPYLVGSPEETASLQIKTIFPSAKISLKYEFHDTVEGGVVISQSPGNGTEIDENTEFELTISKGTEFSNAIVPNVVGKSLEEAKKMIEESGLTVGTTMRMASGNVAEGYIITQTLKAGEEVAKNSIVGLVVSTGVDEAAASTEATSAENTEPSSEIPVPGNVRTLSITVNKPDVPEGTETVTIRMERTDATGTIVVLDTDRMVSEFPFDLPVSGMGEGEIAFYVNDVLHWTEKVTF
ncbi:MAG: PASTA domain-containing protein, partial [Firmicutes bacterium]|nr:PASTA domain-containing protein [Bacillota bacterium]